MLSEKYKQVIESIAFDLQEAVTRDEDVAGSYNINEIVSFLQTAGCEVKFAEKEEDGKLEGSFLGETKTITMNCTKDQLYRSFEEVTHIRLALKILFHEIWHFLAAEFGLQSSTSEDTMSKQSEGELVPQSYSEEFPTQVSEMSANYFARAMLMPKNDFIEAVMRETDLKGICNVFAIARLFCVEYSDVIARGKDLNLWNMKVGI